ncbi:hypothetical protein B0O99DRAFT_672428 [Bisporella sp. PMI_857]|nr:hypothetical protein B0O99DRAFT_672428 [Bisporella sp. PMI_857]
MAGGLPEPRVSRNQQNTQLSYELPNRIYTAKAYPLQSPNGSSIILYGHENGVRIVWRGGRSFRPATYAEAAKKTNGADTNIISLDDDDDSPMTATFVDKPEFEEDEEEHDPSRPYPNILQTLDLYFGADVQSIALLSTSILKADQGPKSSLQHIKQNIVFTAACGDNVVRLVALPLTPPSPASKSRPALGYNFTQANVGNGFWGETIVLLSGHQKPLDAVSMTVEYTDKSENAKSAEIIVASHSREVTGRLLLYRVSLSSPPSHVEPFQTILLSSPARAISFNPALPKEVRSTHLLVADSTGVCRIYDYKRLVNAPANDEDSTSHVSEQGTWLLSLYPGFQRGKTENYRGVHAGMGRKAILDAKWVSNGKAILVLLNDGEWGVWDIEGAGPGASQGLLSAQSITGGSQSSFSLTGFIEGATKIRAAAPPLQITASKFAPMTPSTRKSADLFSGNASSAPVRGQLSVVDVSASLTSSSDESIVFWLGESFAVIPSLSKYWTANVRKSVTGGNIFNGTPGGRIIKLESIDLQGERCSGIDQLPKTKTAPNGLPADIIILGEHRFTILSAGKPVSQFQTSTRIILSEKSNNNSGELLDVSAIDQVLSQMENTNGFEARRKLF